MPKHVEGDHPNRRIGHSHRPRWRAGFGCGRMQAVPRWRV
jgi:hypothetical protein